MSGVKEIPEQRVTKKAHAASIIEARHSPKWTPPKISDLVMIQDAELDKGAWEEAGSKGRVPQLDRRLGKLQTFVSLNFEKDCHGPKILEIGLAFITSSNSWFLPEKKSTQ